MNTLDTGLSPMTPRERVLKKIREALTAAPVEMPKGVNLERNVYVEFQDSPDVVFAEKFIENGGKFLYCENVRDALDTFIEMVKSRSWENRIFCKDPVAADLLDLAGIEYGDRPIDAVLKSVAFCSCRYLVAQDGSIVWDSATMGRRAMAQADEVVFVASVEQVIPDFRSAVRLMKEKKENLPSMISRWTGLSRFTDIDGESMPGVGPGTVYLVLIDNN